MIDFVWKVVLWSAAASARPIHDAGRGLIQDRYNSTIVMQRLSLRPCARAYGAPPWPWYSTRRVCVTSGSNLPWPKARQITRTHTATVSNHPRPRPVAGPNRSLRQRPNPLGRDPRNVNSLSGRPNCPRSICCLRHAGACPIGSPRRFP